MTKRYAGGNQRSKTENLLPSQPSPENSPEKTTEDNVYDDDTSKMTFKEKMILFNKKNAHGLAPSSSLKHNRNRLTQVRFLSTGVVPKQQLAHIHLFPAHHCRGSASSCKYDTHVQLAADKQVASGLVTV